MTGKPRALTAVLIVAAIALVAIVYVAGHLVRPPAAVASDRTVMIAQNDPNAASDNGVPAATLFDRALSRLDSVYYKPFDPQTPFRGEAHALTEYLKARHIASPNVPAQTATGDPDTDAQKLASVVDTVDSEYGKKLGATASSDLTQVALVGIMNSVDDPYTVYLSPREIQSLNEQLNGGDFGGIGVYIYALKGGGVVLQPIEGQPAALAGMKAGAIVESVDGHAVKGVPIDKVEGWIRGPSGSRVVLVTHMYKATKQQRYAITREIIHVPTVEKKMESGYDYIRLSDFGQTSADEVQKALLWGHKNNAKGYILDLRDNGGGLVDAAVKISSFFIPSGTIVSTIDRDGHKDVEEALGDALGGTQPLVVLVNKYTASASEITAGALQDYHLAKIIGTKTYGKGVVQSIYGLPDGGALKITTARYVTPLGRDIQHKGINPDIVVPQNIDVRFDSPQDKQLIEAKAELKKLMK